MNAPISSTPGLPGRKWRWIWSERALQADETWACASSGVARPSMISLSAANIASLKRAAMRARGCGASLADTRNVGALPLCGAASVIVMGRYLRDAAVQYAVVHYSIFVCDTDFRSRTAQ